MTFAESHIDLAAIDWILRNYHYDPINRAKQSSHNKIIVNMKKQSGSHQHRLLPATIRTIREIK